MKTAIEHYEAALKEAFPSGATGDVFHHWNEARKALEQPAQNEPVAWINWCAATGKRSVSFECESELASEPLYAGITQNTQGHYSKFHSWFYSAPHRAKYSTDHPAYLAAQEAWEASGNLKKYNYTNGYCRGRTDLLAEQKAAQPMARTGDCLLTGVCASEGHKIQKACELEQQKPAAYFFTGIKGDGATHGPHLIWKREYMDSMSEQMGAVATPLYTRPPARDWVGLTDEEIDYQAKKDDHAVYFALGALWAEAKLREKNGG